MFTGNVGLQKEANMTVIKEEHNTKFPPTGALDGQIAKGTINIHCAHPSNNESLKIPAEWWADLGDIYKIYNITVYGRRDCKLPKQQFSNNNTLIRHN